MKVVLILTNSADLDKMQHYAKFHPGLQCMPNYLLRGFQYCIHRGKRAISLENSIMHRLEMFELGSGWGVWYSLFIKNLAHCSSH